MTDSRSVYKARVDAAILYMHDHIAEEIDLQRLAKAAQFSPFHFHRIFTSLIGETPQQFLTRLRLELAANMLVKYFGYSITRIAMECGFSSPSTFARAFKIHFGIPAKEYRVTENKPTPTGVNIDLVTKAQLPPIDISIAGVPDWNLAYVSCLNGYRIELICKAWNQLRLWALSKGLDLDQMRALGISYDDPLITPPEKCRYYACLTIPEGVIPQPPIGHLRLPGSKCLVARVMCTAEQIQPVYMYLYREWLVDSGFQPDNLPPYEVYLSAPDPVSGGQFVMDVYIPIVPL